MLLLLVLENGRAVNAQVKVFNIHDKKDVESFLGNAEKKFDLSLVSKKDTSQQWMNTSHNQLLYHSKLWWSAKLGSRGTQQCNSISH